MRKLKLFAKFPTKKEIDVVFYAFSKREKVIFIIFVIILIISTVSILENINKYYMVSIPSRGGMIREGIVGTPRFVNPILAFSDADSDLVSLIYSGLMRKTSDGTLIPDLASKYEMSKNGLIYTFTLKDNLSFQNGKPLTVDDVLFTIKKTKDSVVKSPHKISWDGVTIEKVDAKTVKFTLKQPYASFLENATIGILPAHIWDATPIELNDANINPVGSGPYMINKVSKQSSGIIDSYGLVPFKKFILGEPYIKNINLNFYASEDDMVKALENGSIDQVSSITPLNAENLKERNYDVESSVLPRVFGLFFNQNNNNIFLDKAVITAIDQIIDKNRIVRDVLFGYGMPIDNPIPSNIIEYKQLNAKKTTTREVVLQKVWGDLAKAGWTKGSDGILEKTKIDSKKKKTLMKLRFSISTGNIAELVKTAELIKKDLESVGMKVDVKTFETGNLNQTVIRPRKYDALLFGEIINHESDLFAFWHSSQRKDPGLNVAMYTNAKVDRILEDAFITVDEQSRIKKYILFEDEIKKDMPAVFLYSPNFIYIVSKDIKDALVGNIISTSDRYLNAYKWYINTENVWKIFTQ